MTSPQVEQTSAACLLREVRARAKRRLAFLAWAAEEQGQPVDSLVHVLGEELDAASERDWWQRTTELHPLNRAIEALDEQTRAPSDRFCRLCHVFELGAAESATLKVAVALALSPPLGRGLAALDGQAGKHALSTSHVAQLFGLPAFVLPAACSSLRWRILEVTANSDSSSQCVTADPAIVAWLAGAPLLDAELVNVSATVPERAPLPEWPLAHARQLFADAPGALRLRISGVAGSGRRTFAALVAAAQATTLFSVDVQEASLDAERLRSFWLRACRRVRLTGELLAWSGPIPTLSAELWPHRSFWITTPQDIAPHASLLPSPLIDLPLPEPATRRRLWLEALPVARQWPSAALEHLSLAHRVTVAEIAAIAGLGVASAEQAARAVRETSRGALAGLAQRLDCPFTFDDLLAPAPVRSALDDLLFEARERSLLWKDPELRRLFPLGAGLLALFCGPPGTGKTMSAQVLARELRLDLYRIDLSMIVSKYVGETTKNLERVLANAARLDVVLFFDEADSLFGKRTDIRDAHDRYANTDTNYLLQAVEAYKGVAVLATNRKGNIDGAFLRRLRHVVDFPAPDAPQRLELWNKLVTSIAGERARSDTDPILPTLAASFELSGAQIKYAVLHSLYSSRREQQPFAVRHLVGGVERELQKLGRGIPRGEAKRLLSLTRGPSA